MSRLAFTESEQCGLEHSAHRWLAECERWMQDFDTLQPDPMLDFPSNLDNLVICAMYFIMAAGCVYYHCQSLLEAKKGKEKAITWLKTRRSMFPSLQTLYERRNWMTHGSLRNNRDFKLMFAVVEGPDKTIEEALAELWIKRE